MSTSLLYHTQSIHNYQHCNFSFPSKRKIVWEIIHKADKIRCPVCQSRGHKIKTYRDGNRVITGLKMGNHSVDLNVRMHRIKCYECGSYSRESMGFIPSPKAHHTKAVLKEAVRLRSTMSITDVSLELGVSWLVVKEAERVYLERKYSTISLADLETIGIDELWLGNEYITIVRDIGSGDVVYVADGKDGACLNEFKRRLNHAGSTIKYVCIDMGKAYTKWVKDNLKSAVIIYDKFHVIKLMNDKLNAIRRETMNRLDDTEKKDLKAMASLFIISLFNLSIHLQCS